jgi:prolipoprotein diacylglyceryl transferase
MNGIFSLAWFYWDPSREIFRIPIIDRPLGWYGLCFVLGFILGYFVIIPIFRRKLLETKNLLPRDIKSWPLLARDFKAAQSSHSPTLLMLYQRLSPEAKKQLTQLQLMQEPDCQLKAALLQALNDPKKTFSRNELEALLPQSILPLKEICTHLADRLTWFVTLGTLIGARLGEVFFYDWPHYRNNLLDIFKIWEGGLASHGGTLGIIIAIVLFRKSIQKNFPEFTFLTILDCLCIPTALGCGFIRIGNFFNQEIVGTPTDVPWAIIFGHPVFGKSPVPRHPVQLYEAAAYFTIFVIFYCLWKFQGKKLKEGFLIGSFLIVTFTSRFLLEFFKLPLSAMFDESYLQTGQYLSVPFILGGMSILLYAYQKPHHLQANLPPAPKSYP